MRHLMRQHGGQFGGIIGQSEKATRDVEIPARQRERIYVRRVQNGDLIRLVRIVQVKSQRTDHPRDHALQFRIGIFAAIGRQNSWVLFTGQRCETVAPGYRVDRYWVCRRAEGTFISTKYLTASNGYAHRERDQPTPHEAGRLMWVPVLHGIKRHYRQILDPSSDPSETWQTAKGCACTAIFRTRAT